MFKKKHNKETEKKNTPIDLEKSIKIVNEEEAFWADIQLKCEEHIKKMKQEIKLNEAIAEIAAHKRNNAQDL